MLRYALFSLPVGAVAVALAWDGEVGRGEGAVLVALYAAYVGVIWLVERRPPSLGGTAELEDAAQGGGFGGGRVGQELSLVLGGLVAMAVGATLLVEAVRQISGAEEVQTRLGLTLVGFATAFELVVLACSAARRGMSEAVLAGVVGSFAYNVTMTLGAGALARPLRLLAPDQLRLPLLAMLAALVLVIGLALPRATLTRRHGAVLLLAYPCFVLLVLFR